MGSNVVREVPTAAAATDAGLFFGLALGAEANMRQQEQAGLRDRLVAALAEAEGLGVVGDSPERPRDSSEQSDAFAVATGGDHLAHLGEGGGVFVDFGDRVVAQGFEGQIASGDQLGAAFEEAGAEGRDLGGFHRTKVSERSCRRATVEGSRRAQSGTICLQEMAADPFCPMIEA